MSALDIIHELIKNVKIGIMRNMEKKKMTQEDIMKLLDSCYEKCLNENANPPAMLGRIV